MYGRAHTELSSDDSAAIRSEFDWGVDLFNLGFYWEAHEAWEGVWNAFGRTGQPADFVKGLIKLAAAGVKALEGNSRGVQRHRNRALELLRESVACDSIDCRSGFGVSAKRMIELLENSEIVVRSGAQARQGSVMPFTIIDES